MNKSSNFWQKCEFSTTVTLFDTLWHSEISTPKTCFWRVFYRFFHSVLFFPQLVWYCLTLFNAWFLSPCGRVCWKLAEKILKTLFSTAFVENFALNLCKSTRHRVSHSVKMLFKALERLFQDWRSLSQEADPKPSFFR